MTHYDLLQVSRSASQEVVHASWKVLMARFHPDKKTGNAKKARELNAAYDVLKDPQKRAEYDRSLLGVNGDAGTRTRAQEQYQRARKAQPNGNGMRSAYGPAYRRDSDGIVEGFLSNAAAGQVDLETLLTNVGIAAVNAVREQNPVIAALMDKLRNGK